MTFSSQELSCPMVQVRVTVSSTWNEDDNDDDEVDHDEEVVSAKRAQRTFAYCFNPSPAYVSMMYCLSSSVKTVGSISDAAPIRRQRANRPTAMAFVVYIIIG